MIELIVVDINNYKWKNTDWKDRIVQIEIGYLHVLDGERLRSIIINGKTLGLIALEKMVLPIRSKLFATMELCDGRLYIKAIDKPDSYMAHIKDVKQNSVSKDILSKCWDESDEFDETGKARLERMKNEVSPHFFYEWLLRSGLHEKDISVEIIDEYLAFQSWLYTAKKMSELNYGHDEFLEHKNHKNSPVNLVIQNIQPLVIDNDDNEIPF